MAWRVILTRHASERYAERAGRARLRTALVQRRLRAMLRSGARPEPDGSVHVGLGGGLRAVCVPVAGGWLVVTVYRARLGGVAAAGHHHGR